MPARLLAVVLLSMAALRVQAQSDTVDLIVQFRQPARAARMRMTAEAIAARSNALDSSLAALRSDLGRTGRIAATAADTPIIRHTYHRVLLGASIRVRRDMEAAVRALPYVASVHEDVQVHAL